MPADNTLVIETSTPCGSIGLHCAETWIDESFTSHRGHNSEIFSPLQNITSDLTSGEIQQILVGTGPGSYSGTRVGIAVAQGIAVVHGSTIIGIPSLLGLPSARRCDTCLAIGDARRGDWWWAWIHHGKMPQAPQLGKIDELLAQVALCPDIVSLDAIHHPDLTNCVRQETPSAAALWEAWLQHQPEERASMAANLVQPLYLKPPHITAPKSGHPLQPH